MNVSKKIEEKLSAVENPTENNLDSESNINRFYPNHETNKIYNAVKNDKLTPTIFAYYYCDKPNQTILSDKESASIKQIGQLSQIENRGCDPNSEMLKQISKDVINLVK